MDSTAAWRRRSRDLRPGETYITIRIIKGKDADADDPAAPLLLPRAPTKSIDDDFVGDDGGDVDDWRQPAINCLWGIIISGICVIIFIFLYGYKTYLSRIM
ncbi:hypothetical protein DAI22_02g159650 [Oryza sativa Japonica Group]|nr:hypothetical protein DAI22_02g159650 [Oryza sativa Japonica Group]